MGGSLSRFVVTGSASGIGAATRDLLFEQGHDVVGIDLRDADITADLGTPQGRQAAAVGVPGPLDGIVLCAGLVGLTGRPGSLLASVNYFGAVELAELLRPQLLDPSSVVMLSSNSVTIQRAGTSPWSTPASRATSREPARSRTARTPPPPTQRRRRHSRDGSGGTRRPGPQRASASTPSRPG